MRSIFFLAVVVAALTALATAKPSHAIIAALLRKEPGRDLHARSGIDPSSISKECQPDCTSVLQKLDVRSLFQFRTPSLPSLGPQGRFWPFRVATQNCNFCRIARLRRANVRRITLISLGPASTASSPSDRFPNSALLAKTTWAVEFRPLCVTTPDATCPFSLSLSV